MLIPALLGKASSRAARGLNPFFFLQRRKLRPSERRHLAQDPAQERALWAPSVVFMDDIEPFDPKSGLYEWVRGPQAEPARVLVASWGRGPVAGVKPGSVAQSLLGGRSQGREHFA